MQIPKLNPDRPGYAIVTEGQTIYYGGPTRPHEAMTLEEARAYMAAHYQEPAAIVSSPGGE